MGARALPQARRRDPEILADGVIGDRSVWLDSHSDPSFPPAAKFTACHHPLATAPLAAATCPTAIATAVAAATVTTSKPTGCGMDLCERLCHMLERVHLHWPFMR